MFTLLLTTCCYNYLVLEVPGKPLACPDVWHGSVSLNDLLSAQPTLHYWQLQGNWRSWICCTLFFILLVWKLENVTDMMSRVLCVCREQCHLLECGLFCGRMILGIVDNDMHIFCVMFVWYKIASFASLTPCLLHHICWHTVADVSDLGCLHHSGWFF